MKSRKQRTKSVWPYAVSLVLILVMIYAFFWFSSGVRSPKTAARRFVEAWASYDINAMKSVSSAEMSEGMVAVYFGSIKNSVEAMRQAIASAEGMAISAVEPPIKWDKWTLRYAELQNGVVEVTGTVTWKFTGYDQVSTISRPIHWIVHTEKGGRGYSVSGLDIVADDSFGAVWNFLESMMSRNAFYIKKTTAVSSSERLLGYLAAMQIEFTQGSAQKGWVFLHPVVEEQGSGVLKVSYYRVALGSGSGSSITADPAVVTAKFTCADNDGKYQISDVEFEEAR
ncbi:hypothetical protein HPY42_05625 [Coprothermobacteraceae bacterium]|nr:hypothetical protein [Coprothermobacteraceae bacterium]